MNESDGNPPGNRLAAGLSDEALSEAVESSGYPLQTVVAAQLSRLGFSITEEWVFTDSESGKARALDVHAAKPLYDRARASGSRVRPALALLIECKQSEMP